MASLGHIAVGLAAARTLNDGHLPRWGPMIAWAALSMLPDADVVGFAFGMPYGAPWGHRGATHSLAFAVIVGTIVGSGAALWRSPGGGAAPSGSGGFGGAIGSASRSGRRTGAIAILVLASHGLLDTFTDGGLGCALFWPFDLTRYFALWRPIPVSPIGLGYLSPYGLMVALTEILLFAPLFLYAVRPAARRRLKVPTAAILMTAWVVVVWLIGSTDPIRDRAIGMALRERTEFASGFSEAAFRNVSKGDSEARVRQSLGAPIGESWIFGPGDRPAVEASAEELAPSCGFVSFRGEVVARTYPPDFCGKLGIVEGAPKRDVARVLGPPTDRCLDYTGGESGRFHRVRAVCFFQGQVVEVLRLWARASG